MQLDSAHSIGRVDPSEAVYAVVRAIPMGCVATYGQVAGMVEGLAITPRQVGMLMTVAPPDIPWQRVVGAGGRLPISKRSPVLAKEQRRLLEAEGVGFLDTDAIDMCAHQWTGTGI